MRYYVYENWLHKKAIVHKGICRHCNDGSGCHSSDSERYGRWLGPFETEVEAMTTAFKTKRKRIAKCSFCLVIKKK